MRRFLVSTLANALGLWVAAQVVPDIAVTGSRFSNDVATFAVLGGVLAVVNAVVRPVVRFFSLPLTCLTLGLFTWVINALMIRLMGAIAEQLGFAFESGPFFWSTLAAAVITTFMSLVADSLLGGDKD